MRTRTRQAKSVAPNAHWAASGLLLVLFAMLALGARQLSFTADEPAYIVGGYALWAGGTEAFSLLPQRGYPPLLAALEAALIVLAEPDIPLAQLPGWPGQYDPLIHAFEPYLVPLARARVVSRMPVIWLTVLLGAVVFRWAKDLWGQSAALLALFALSFDPLLLAHGRLATTDAGVVMLGTAALYAVWRWSNDLLVSAHVSWGWTLGIGGLLGLTMLAKISGPLWAVAAAMIMLVAMLHHRGTRARSGDLRQKGTRPGCQGCSTRPIDERLWWQVLAAGSVSLLVFWAGYGFTWGRVPGVPFSVPAPAHWQSSLYLRAYTSVYCALGRRWYEPQWWYFPLAFLIKNPLPLLIGLVVSWGLFLRRSLSPLRLVALGFFPLLYTGVAIGQGMNIGYRHMLPVHPFLYLSIGGGLRTLWLGRSWRGEKYAGNLLRQLQKWGGGLLAAWYIVSTLRVFPNELAYFNILVGGPTGGYRYLADSNLGWGQSGQVLETYLREHPEAKVAPPAAKFHPSPGRYVINASYLYGLGIGDIYAYEWFRHREPEGYVDYNWLIYDVPPVDIDWFAQCEIPVAPLSADEIMQRMRGVETPGAQMHSDLRIVGFDCTQAWLYPDGGTKAGIYALHHDLEASPQFPWPLLRHQSHSVYPPPEPKDPFIARHLESAHLSFERIRTGSLPPFVLYTDMNQSNTQRMDTVSPFAVYPAPADVPPSSVDVTPWPTPIPLEGGPLTFLGITYLCEDKSVEIETWWRVDTGPILRPFSIMAHLTTEEGIPLSTADGLGTWPLTLITGDIIVQRHRFEEVCCGSGCAKSSVASGFSLPSDNSDSLWLRTGAYWLDLEMARWEIIDQTRTEGLSDALWIQLE